MFFGICWATAEGGGGQNVTRDFGWGGKRTAERALQTTFGGLRNWAWSGRCLFPLREMTESRQKGGGGERSVGGGGGPKTFLGRGFTVCFPPPSAAL